MARQTILPFGPQHPVLPEPIHLDLIVEDEHVVESLLASPLGAAFELVRSGRTAVRPGVDTHFHAELRRRA